MSDLAQQLIALVLCVAAIGFAAHFPKRERHAAVMASMVLFLNWLFSVWAVQPFAPQVLLGHIGLHLKGDMMWPFGDCVAGVLFLYYGLPNRWSWLLWIIAICQEVAHYAQNDWYLATLDGLLALQLSVFFYYGGAGVADYLHSSARRSRLRIRALSEQAFHKRRA